MLETREISASSTMEKLKEADKECAREILKEVLWKHLNKLSPRTQETK